MQRNYTPRTGARHALLTTSAEPDAGLMSMGGLASMTIGFLAAIPIHYIGRIYIGETLLGLAAPVMIPLVFSLPGAFGRTTRILLIAMFVSWIGYICSDIYRGTPTFDYIRGWFRWLSLISLFVTLAYLGSKNIRYVLLFMLGWCCGSALYPLLVGGGLGVVQWWKFYAGFSACFAGAFFAGRLGPTIAASTMVSLAAVSIVLDSRAIMLMCVVTAAAALVGGYRSKSGKPMRQALTRTRVIFAVITLGLCALASFFIVQKAGEMFGYAERFRGSNIKRWANVEIAYNILKDSPFIGYGSWARDPEIARIRDKIVEKRLGSHAYRSEAQEDLVIVHSQVLQSWVEGGLLGLTFFIAFGWQLADKGLRLAVQVPYEPALPAMAFLVASSGWHYLGSPFSGTMRVLIACTCVVACHVARRVHEAPAAALAAPRYAWPRRLVRYHAG